MLPGVSALTAITLPGRLVLRALDDLHVLAETAGTLHDVEARMTRHLDALEGHAARMVELAERVTNQMDAGVDAAQRLGEQGERIIAQGERIAEQGPVLAARAAEVAREGARLAEALPTLQRAIDIVEPLQGTVERMGRIADRLPGGRPRAE
jgi:hypothetical protein